MILSEQLLLIALDDRKGSSWNSALHAGLAGGLLADLGRLEALRLDGKHLQPVDGAAPEHPLLARTHRVIAGAGKPRRPKAWVQRLPRELKPFTETVAAGLVQRGVLTERRRTILGLFPITRFPTADPAPERELRARLRAVLTGRAEPAGPDALLIGLLRPLGLIDGLVHRGDRRLARKRAKTLADEGVAGDAVSRAVQEVQAAVLVAAAGAAASSGGGGPGGGGGGGGGGG